MHWWSRRKQECCDLQKLTRQVVRTVTKITQINLSYRGLHSDVPSVRCEVSRALTRRGLATLARLRTEASALTGSSFRFLLPFSRNGLVSLRVRLKTTTQLTTCGQSSKPQRFGWSAKCFKWGGSEGTCLLNCIHKVCTSTNTTSQAVYMET